MSTNIVAGSTPTDYEAATSHTITVRETLAGASNSPRDTVLTINVSDVADTSSWTPASLSGTVHFFSAPLAVTQSGGIVSAVPDRNGGSNWVPHGLGDDGAGTQPLSYGATSFGGAPGFITLGGRGLRYAGVTGSSAVWTFFASVNLDSTYGVARRIWSAAPQGGFQDFGNDGLIFSSNGAGANLGTEIRQDSVPVNQILMTYDAIHTLILTCSGSSVAVYVDGILATTTGGSGLTNPSTPASSPWTLASTVDIGCMVRGDASNANGAKGLFQSGGFKIGGTALNSTDIANLHAWMLSPV